MEPRDLERWIGRKVTVGTAAGHYVSGVVAAVAAGTLAVTVRGTHVQVACAAVVSVQPAPPEQAEYVK